MNAISQVQTLSRWLKRLTTFALIFLPLGLGGWLVALVIEPDQMAGLFPDLPVETSFTRGKVALAAVVAGLAVIPALCALWQMQKLFGRYLAGQVLTAEAARHIRRIGLWMVGMAGVGVVLPTLQALILTMDNPAGKKVLMVALSSDSLGFVMAGGLLTVIGWAMSEAARAAEENAGFV